MKYLKNKAIFAIRVVIFLPLLIIMIAGEWAEKAGWWLNDRLPQVTRGS